MSHIKLVFVTQGTVLFLKFLYVHHNATTYVSHGRNAIRDESTSSLSPRRKQNHTTKFFTEVTQFYSFILSRRCLRRSGQSRREKNNKICVKIEFYFFSISSKNNVGGSVNHKIKKVWPWLDHATQSR